MNTTEVSVLAIKAKGGKLPEHFLTEIHNHINRINSLTLL